MVSRGLKSGYASNERKDWCEGQRKKKKKVEEGEAEAEKIHLKELRNVHVKENVQEDVNKLTQEHKQMDLIQI